MDVLTSLISQNGYLPHNDAFVWTSGLLWTMVAADAIIAAAFFTIPFALLSYMRQRSGPSMQWITWFISAFIFSCGVTHVMDIWMMWRPYPVLLVLTKVTTAGLSLAAALALWRLIPKSLDISSVKQLKAVISSLEAEVCNRRSAEDQLEEIQQSLALTLASIGAGFIATDREGRVTRMNAVAEQVMGWTQLEAKGQSYWTVFTRENRPALHTAVNVVDLVIKLELDMNTVNHFVVIARDGRRTKVEVKAAPTRAADGTVRGITMVFRDMTLLLRTQMEASHMADIVESSSNAIIGNTLDGHITSWNGAAQTVFGYTAAEAIGQSVQMLMLPQSKGEEMRKIAELANGAIYPAYETVRRAKDASLVQVSVSISLIRNTKGRVTGFSKIVRDLSQQRRAEAAFRGSEARLRFTLDAAHIGDWNLDLITGTVNGSQQFAQFFGYDKPDINWTLDTFVQHIHPDDRYEVLRSFDTTIAELTDLVVECRVVWPDSSIHWINLHGNIETDVGKPVRMLGIVIETTQKRLAEKLHYKTQLLEAENQQMQKANKLKSQFMANMSHELRTPLNAIIGFSRLLESGAVAKESPKYEKFLTNISTSGRHLLQLINDVLDLSKAESGTFDYSAEPINLSAMLKEVIDVLHQAIDSKSLHVKTDIDPTLTDLSLDESRLKQVLYNLLSNAIKFTPADGHVSVRAFAQGAGHFRLEVEDTGIGISPKDLPRLFVEFQQLDSGYSKQHQGTGLGLALTRRLVQAQGGTVGVHSTLGVGSVFHVVLNRIHGTDALAAKVNAQTRTKLPAQMAQIRPVTKLSASGVKL